MNANFKLFIAGLVLTARILKGVAADQTILNTMGEPFELNENVSASAIYGNGIYVAVNRKNILTSLDKIHWTARDSGSLSSLQSVAYGKDRFVAVGNEGIILSSPDGLRWNIEKSTTDERLRGVAYGNGSFVAVGYLGTVLTSSNGRAWRQRNSGTEVRLQAIAYGDDIFVAVGWDGVILTSPNGVRWTRLGAETSADYQSVSYSSTNNVLLARDRCLVEQTVFCRRRRWRETFNLHQKTKP